MEHVSQRVAYSPSYRNVGISPEARTLLEPSTRTPLEPGERHGRLAQGSFYSCPSSHFLSLTEYTLCPISLSHSVFQQTHVCVLSLIAKRTFHSHFHGLCPSPVFALISPFRI